jgi:hypothetical protein
MALQREEIELGNYAMWEGNNFLLKTRRREIM